MLFTFKSLQHIREHRRRVRIGTLRESCLTTNIKDKCQFRSFIGTRFHVNQQMNQTIPIRHQLNHLHNLHPRLSRQITKSSQLRNHRENSSSQSLLKEVALSRQSQIVLNSRNQQPPSQASTASASVVQEESARFSTREILKKRQAQLSLSFIDTPQLDVKVTPRSQGSTQCIA